MYVLCGIFFSFKEYNIPKEKVSNSDAPGRVTLYLTEEEHQLLTVSKTYYWGEAKDIITGKSKVGRVFSWLSIFAIILQGALPPLCFPALLYL